LAVAVDLVIKVEAVHRGVVSLRIVVHFISFLVDEPVYSTLVPVTS